MFRNTILISSFLILIIFIACAPPSEEQTEETSMGIPIEAVVVSSTSIDQTLPFTTTLNPIHEVDLIAEVSGEVVKIKKELGDYVTTRDTLAYLDDVIPESQYLQARSQVLSAKNNLMIAELNMKSDQELYDKGDISKLAYQQSELSFNSAKANYLAAVAGFEQMEKGFLETRITTPIKGFVSRKWINLGTMVSPGMPVYHVVDMGVLKCQVSVAQSLISRVYTGSKVTLTISSIKNQTFKGEVKYISPQADERTGGFMVEIHVPNTKDFKIRAGVTAKVDLTISELGEQIVIPEHALVKKSGSDYVYRVEDGNAKLVPVILNEIVGGQVVIESGLAIGDTIVVVGMDNLGMDTPVWIEALIENE